MLAAAISLLFGLIALASLRAIRDAAQVGIGAAIALSRELERMDRAAGVRRPAAPQRALSPLRLAAA